MKHLVQASFIAALLVVLAACSGPEPPAQVEAATPPPREEHPLVRTAIKFGRDPGQGEIKDRLAYADSDTREAQTANCQVFYHPGGKVSRFTDLHLQVVTAKRNAAEPIQFGSRETYVSAARAALELLTDEPLGASWSVRRIEIPEPRSPRNEGFARIWFQQTVNGYVVSGANSANVELVGDTLEPMRVSRIDRYKPEPLEFNFTEATAAEIADRYVRGNGHVPLKVKSLGTEYAIGNIDGEERTRTKRNGMMKLLYFFWVDVKDRAHQEIGVSVRTGDVVCFSDAS